MPLSPWPVFLTVGLSLRHMGMGRRYEYQVTNQRAVMPCDWGVNAGIIREWVAGKIAIIGHI